MVFTRNSQTAGLPALIVGVFVTLGGAFLAFVGFVALNSENTPTWLAWAAVASGLFMAAGGVAETAQARRGVRGQRA